MGPDELQIVWTEVHRDGAWTPASVKYGIAPEHIPGVSESGWLEKLRDVTIGNFIGPEQAAILTYRLVEYQIEGIRRYTAIIRA